MTVTAWLNRTLATGPFLSLCMSEREYRARLKYVGHENRPYPVVSEHAKASTHTMRHAKTGALVCLVGLDPAAYRADQIEVLATLVHEAVHVWQQYREAVGESAPGIEQEANAIERIAKELIREYMARRKAAGKRRR